MEHQAQVDDLEVRQECVQVTIQGHTHRPKHREPFGGSLCRRRWLALCVRKRVFGKQSQTRFCGPAAAVVCTPPKLHSRAGREREAQATHRVFQGKDLRDFALSFPHRVFFRPPCPGKGDLVVVGGGSVLLTFPGTKSCCSRALLHGTAAEAGDHRRKKKKAPSGRGPCGC